MTRLRFVHAADLHLDSPFTGLTNVADDVGAVLREATFEAYATVVRLCIDEQVDALLVAGDIYDGADRSLPAQLKFIDGLWQLEKAGIRSFICHGNHDPLDGWEARLDLPPGCHRFGSEVEAVPLDPGEPGKATVYGVSYPRREVRENLVPRFGRVNDAGFSIGLLHCNVGSNTGHEAYAPCTVEDLAGAGIDYWALGHVHNRQVLREQGPAIVYPGNPQGRHPSETGVRGVYLVDVGEGGYVNLQFRQANSVRWERIDVSIDGLETEQALLDRIDAEVGALVDAGGGIPVVYRLEIGGRGPLHHALGRSGFAGGLRQQVNEIWAAQNPFAWCGRARVGTMAPFDRDQRRQANDFVGDLLRLVDSVRTDPEELAGLAQGFDALYGHGRARRYLRDAAPGQEELLALLKEAETICVEELAGEETL